MRLLNVDTLLLESFHDEKATPSYLILSHTWEDEEVLFDDLQRQPRDAEVETLRRVIENLERRLCDIEGTLASREGSHNETKISDGRLGDTAARMHPAQRKRGWGKIDGCCREAKSLGFLYV
jgi:hypothetical protein